jgi:hypothetical protein
MVTVEAIYTSPIKSLGLAQPEAVRVDPHGITEDRRFHLVGLLGALLTQREVGRLVQVKAEYQVKPERLRLQFPGGSSLEGPVELGEPVVTQIWGRNVAGRMLSGDWNDALSGCCGQVVRLVRPDQPGECYDEYPISLVSRSSIEELSRQPGAPAGFEGRRFRPNFLLAGCGPHEEDSWIGAIIRIGEELLLRVVARDPRCAITTHDPQSGKRDVDTLRLILSYRPSTRAAYFGVYGIVERPGTVSLGDEVVLHPTGEGRLNISGH